MLKMERVALSLLATSFLMLAVSATHAAEKPNILFIFADDHAVKAISAYPGALNDTPNLDRIANEGMRFDRAYVTNSICGPSRAVILTGKYSHLNGFTRNGNTFYGGQQTFPKLLRKAGYQTAVVGKWHLKSEPTGFDYWNVLIGQGPYYNPPMKTSEGVTKHTGYTTEVITDLTLDWLKEKRDPAKPFMLMYQHKAPHRDWQPGPKQLSLYDDVTFPEPETLFDDYSHRASGAKDQAMEIGRHMSERDLKLIPNKSLNDEQRAAWDAAYVPKNEAFRAAKLEGKDLVRWKYQRYIKDYLRCINSVDENVGRILSYLDETGLADNTMVVYSSDQGFYLGEHGWFDKRWMYEESFRTPLMVRWPGKVKPGSVSNALSLNLDFPETFLQVAGVEVPGNMQGHSLLPVLLGEKEQVRDAIYYHYYEFPGAHSVPKHYGVFDGRYKLIHYYDLDEWELFDLKTDPMEMKSVYGEENVAKIQRRLEKRLSELRDQFKDDGTVAKFPVPARTKQKKNRKAA